MVATITKLELVGFETFDDSFELGDHTGFVRFVHNVSDSYQPPVSSSGTLSIIACHSSGFGI